MIKTILKGSRGFTLVELLVVVSLMGIVLAIGYMFFSFGVGTFARGERQAIAQQSIRSSTDFISNEIRYASELILNPDNKNEAGYHYIIQDNGSVIYHYIDSNGVKDQERVLLNSESDGINYSISFNEDSIFEQVEFKVVISFNIEAEDNLYALETKVNILNIIDQEQYLVETGLPSAIKYKKPY